MCVYRSTQRGRLPLVESLLQSADIPFVAGEIAAVVFLLRRPVREWYGISRPPSQPGEWRPDPSGRHQFRYWDGEGWTEHMSDEGVAGVDRWGGPQGGVL